MPILDIIDDTGKLRQLAPVNVAAVMVSPTDERRRDEIVATGYVDTALQISQPIPPEIAEVIHCGPSAAIISSQAGPQGYLGWIAGQILLFVLRCAAHRPEDASVRKAIDIIERALARAERLQERKFPSSTAKLRDAWSKYKSVCHFWAALHILEKGEYGLNPENLTEFLGTAEILRRKAERHYPLSDKGLARLGIDRAIANRAGGLAWSQITIFGRGFDLSPSGFPAVIQPVWRGCAPSIYQAMENPVLDDLIAWCPAEPGQWWYRWGASWPALGDHYIDAAHIDGDPLTCHLTPLGWLRGGCRGCVILGIAEGFAEVAA